MSSTGWQRRDTLSALFQTAYVTNDLERAAEVVGNNYGIPDFYMSDIYEVPHVDGGAARIRVALAWVGSTQLELIQPMGGRDEVYRDFLPKEDFGVRHHHFCGRIATREDFAAAQEEFAASGQRILYRMMSERLCAFYADTLSILGHYLEYVWLSDDGPLTLDGKIPIYCEPFLARPAGL